MTKYFFDTYALVALAKSNPNYVKYSDEIVVTSIYNLVELYYIILKNFKEEKAKMIYRNLKDCITDVKDEVIFEAMNLKLKNKKLSYVGCVGYIHSLKNNLLFLTGDREFKNMPKVEFVP